MKPRLLTPAQTQIPQRVIAAMAGLLPPLRSKDFKEVFRDVSGKLQILFQTEHEVLTLTSSGTGAMEAALVNFLRQGDKVITIEGGKFGARWGEIARRYGLLAISLKVPWGETADIDQVERLLLQHPDAAAVFLTHSETSTGVAFDLEAIAKVVRRESDALVVVDGISSVGVIPLYKDDWNIDICVAASQKGAMLPPGLAFLAVNQRGWHKAEESDLPRYYFDALKAREALEGGDTPWTPAISLITGLRESLSMILDEGLKQRWEKFARLAYSIREAAKAIGLELFPKSPSDAVTAIKVPQGINGRELVKCLQEKYCITVAGGQEHLKGKIFRVGHMGYCDYLDTIAFASAMELALRDFGWQCELGKTVATAHTAYVNYVRREE